MSYIYNNSQSGLSDSDVMSIRLIAQNKSLSQVARQYGIGKSTASDIVNRKTWSHVPAAKPVKGYSNYLILPDGRVWDSKTKAFLSPKITKNEGIKIILSANGKRKSIPVANLVAQAFHSSNKNNIRFNDNNRYNVHFTNIKV